MNFIEIVCPICEQKFLKQVKHVNEAKKLGHISTCSKSCEGKNKTKQFDCSCVQCFKIFSRNMGQIKKSKNLFCSSSCAAKFNNSNKKFGVRVSKLETELQKSLSQEFTNINFHFNRKDTINSELDIFIPSLKIAFELNGIYHYKPIFGEDKLLKIKTNDLKKLKLCSDNQITLHVINTSLIKHIKPETIDFYFNFIKSIIQENLANQN